MNHHLKHPEVSDVFRAVIPEIANLNLSADKRRVITSILSCRTSRLGGHIRECNTCGHKEQAYNSCWNRHCPKCRGGSVFDWVSAREEDLLPVPYYHVVFTLPQELRTLCYQNKRAVYDVMFRASAEAMQDATKTRYDAQLGFFGVLHTWNQELRYHPHIHFVIAGGGITPDKQCWQPVGNERFFLPVRVLSKLYRGKVIYYLKELYRREKLNFFGDSEYLKDPRAFEHLMSKATTNDWVVYAKKPFAGPERVIKYLASYTHKVAISNARLRSVNQNQVQFVARDPKRKHKKRILKITPKDFVNRFLLHLIPKGYKRIRYYGYLFNAKREENMVLLRKFFDSKPITQAISPLNACLHCLQGTLSLSRLIKPHRKPLSLSSTPDFFTFALDPPTTYNPA